MQQIIKNIFTVKICFIAIVLLLLNGNTAAQTQRPHTGLWTTVFLPVKFSSKFQWHNEGGYRTLGTSSSPLQYFYRTAIRYTANEKINTAAGVAFFFSRTGFAKSNNEFGKEVRIWEEMVTQTTFTEKLQWQNRLRVEQRFFAATSKKDEYNAFRFRFKTGLIRELNKKWSVQFADEYMQQIAHNQFSFDQNRFIVNGILKCKHACQLQAGYMWLAWPAKSNQHILLVTVQKQLSFHGG